MAEGGTAAHTGRISHNSGHGGHAHGPLQSPPTLPGAGAGAGVNKFYVCCNICLQPAEGIAYATRCHHLLCLHCAKKSFNSSKACPVCAFILSKADLIELSIGIVPRTNLTENIYHNVYSTKDWSQNLENLSNAMNAVRLVTDFTSQQLVQEMAKSSQHTGSMAREIELYRAELIAQQQGHGELLKAYEGKLRTTEDTLASRDAAIAELSREVKESQRKSGAWEKAYCNLRDQLADRDRGPAAGGAAHRGGNGDGYSSSNSYATMSHAQPETFYQQLPGQTSNRILPTAQQPGLPPAQHPQYSGILPRGRDRALMTASPPLPYGGQQVRPISTHQLQQGLPFALQPQQQQHFSHSNQVNAMSMSGMGRGSEARQQQQDLASNFTQQHQHQQSSMQFKYRRQSAPPHAAVDSAHTIGNKENSAFSIIRHGEWKLVPENSAVASMDHTGRGFFDSSF